MGGLNFPLIGMVLLFTIEIVLSGTVVEVNDGKAALLKELSGAHLLIAASPVWFLNQINDSI